MRNFDITKKTWAIQDCLVKAVQVSIVYEMYIWNFFGREKMYFLYTKDKIST